MSMNIIERTAFARAGLIGNPSDGYGGRTISFTMQKFSASVVMYPWHELEIRWSQEDNNLFKTIDYLVEDVIQHGYYGGVRLVKATIKRFAQYCRAHNYPLHDQPFAIRYKTNIPRGVGLSGSSAIVTATLRCLMEFYKSTESDEDFIRKVVQPSIVRSVENDELQIACGYQDRVAQVYEGLVYMDFGKMYEIDGYKVGDYQEMDTSLLPPIYIAYDSAAAKTSDSTHKPLRESIESDKDLLKIMTAIADLVLEARTAIKNCDFCKLHALINRNFDLRSELYDIPVHQSSMIKTARSVGASAKFAGSGGAIVGTYEDEKMFKDLQSRMRKKNPAWQVFDRIDIA